MEIQLNKALPLIVSIIAIFSLQACESLPDKLIWKNEDSSAARQKRDRNRTEELSPAGLKESATTSPITTEEARKTALSRPKVIKVEDLANQDGSQTKYFDVVDERASETLAPTIDESARAFKIITYDNKAVAKEFRLRFGTAWERALEGLLSIALNTVDRSSGIITTEWIYDEPSGSGGPSLNPFGSDRRLRYKYTVRILDKGASTQIKVVPFMQVLSKGGSGWKPALPSLMVTDRLFDQIEKELMIPLPNERF